MISNSRYYRVQVCVQTRIYYYLMSLYWLSRWAYLIGKGCDDSTTVFHYFFISQDFFRKLISFSSRLNFQISYFRSLFLKCLLSITGNHKCLSYHFIHISMGHQCGTTHEGLGAGLTALRSFRGCVLDRQLPNQADIVIFTNKCLQIIHPVCYTFPCLHEKFQPLEKVDIEYKNNRQSFKFKV